MAQLQKYQDDFFLLLEGGYIAAHQADEDAAMKLFRAAQTLKPENFLVKIGFGYVHLLKLELKQANQFFEEVLKKEPNNEMARALLGLSTALTIKEAEKGEKLLQEALKRTNDGTVKSMANTALDFIAKFVKKAPTPVQAQPATKKKGKK